MIICGTAGTHKTCLINALKQVIGEKSIVTGTTGIATFNIHGQTLHSAAQLPICENKELQGESLQHLQLKLEGKEYLTVSEMFMVRQQITYRNWISRYTICRNNNYPVGGLWTIASGG